MPRDSMIKSLACQNVLCFLTKINHYYDVVHDAPFEAMINKDVIDAWS